MIATTATGKAGTWLEDPGFGIYVHIPFCRRRCHYCDFNTYEGQDHLHRAYVDALVADIDAWTGLSPPATSVFFGGGTPTLLPAHGLGRVLRAIDARFGLAPGAEITVEANPETVDAATFEVLLTHGFNRVSVGVQSLSERVLGALGRTHSAGAALEAVRAARRAGVDDVNVDLIYGSPWERADEWRMTLEAIAELGPEHVSAYALTVEEGTPLHTLVATGRVPDVDPDVQAERHEAVSGVLAAAGYARYEVSNWARPGHACAHNVLYWSAGDYAGFGAGAHGHLLGRRYWNVRLPRDFIAAVDARAPTTAGEERLGDDERAGEALALGLRLRDGVRIDGFARRFGFVALDRRSRAIDALLATGAVERADGWLRIAPSATLLGNEIASRLL